MSGLGIGATQGGRNPETYQYTKASRLEYILFFVAWSALCMLAGGTLGRVMTDNGFLSGGNFEPIPSVEKVSELAGAINALQETEG